MVKPVLLLETDEHILSLITLALQPRGYSLFPLSSGKAALERLSDHRYELVIVGERLDDIDGVSWIAQLRLRNTNLPVAFVADRWHGEELYQRLTSDLRVNLVVHRPIKSNLFAAQIESLFVDSALVPPEKEFNVPPDKMLQRHFAKLLPARVERVSAAVDMARRQPENGELVAEARRLAHNLKGTASSCGFPDIGELCAQIEKILMAIQQQSGDAPKLWQSMSAILDCTKELALEHWKQDQAVLERDVRDDTVGYGSRARLLLVTSDTIDRAELSGVDCAGLPLDIFPVCNAPEALFQAQSLSYDGALIDSALPDAFQLARRLRSLPGCENLPLGFVHEGNPLSAVEQVDATYSGCSIYLSKPLTVSSVGESARYLIGINQGGRPRVLIVDDDDDFAAVISLVLGREGMLVKHLAESTGILDFLPDFLPDVILLDVMMPGTNGFDTCRQLRDTARWRDTPILFLTAQTDIEARINAFVSGGDDYLPKPIVPIELLTRVRSRLERARLLRERADKDMLTGLLLRRAFLEQLHALCSEFGRLRGEFTLALLDVDHFKRVNDTFGHFAGDRVLEHVGSLLTRRFRVEDVRGRWGGEEFVVAFKHVHKNAIRPALERVLDELRQERFAGDNGDYFSVSFSAGMVSYPEDGVTGEILLRKADRLLYAAKVGGRNRIVAELDSVSRPTETAQLDDSAWQQ